MPLSVAKSTHPSPWAGVCHALHSGETPVCVGPGAGTGVLGPRAIVVVGVTTPPVRESVRFLVFQLDMKRGRAYLDRHVAGSQHLGLYLEAGVQACKSHSHLVL